MLLVTTAVLRVDAGCFTELLRMVQHPELLLMPSAAAVTAAVVLLVALLTVDTPAHVGAAAAIQGSDI